MFNLSPNALFRSAPKSHDLRIDTLRGVACFLLVMYHVIGAYSHFGLHVSDDSLYRYFADGLIYVRMPLFTFISGIVYAYHPVEADTSNYIVKKVRRLILPMLTVGTAYAILQSMTSDEPLFAGRWQMMHILPVAHFWFIEAIFFIFIAMIPLEKLKVFRSPKTFLAVWAASIGLFLSPIDIPYFALSSAFFLFPFFLLGVAMHRFNVMENLNRYWAAILLAIVAILVVKEYQFMHETFSLRTVQCIIIGTLSCIGLIALRWRQEFLARIGYYSYSIYLFHIFFTAAARIVMTKLGFDNTLLLFFVGTAGGLVGPIILDHIFSQFQVTRIFLLGKSGKIGEPPKRSIGGGPA